MVFVVYICSLAMFAAGISMFAYFKLLPNNYCDMTYMFQYPEFIEIPIPLSEVKQYPHYHLFAYGEGLYADQLRRQIFDGIPVLFIPGNAGSYRQVRSLASVSMVKSDRTRGSPKFNYFTIDFDEELAGIYGRFLVDQTKFLAICIKRIFSLYPKMVQSKTKIVLIGHSMGGLVARGVVSFNYTDEKLISVIFTLATPNVKPVISFDKELIDYYSLINKIDENKNKAEIAYVSIAGGLRDIMVRADLTPLKTNSNLRQDFVFNQISSSLSHVWSSTDHLCAVWCNQLVRTIVRSLFDMFDQKGDDLGRKLHILQKHFGDYVVFDDAVQKANVDNSSFTLIDDNFQFGKLQSEESMQSRTFCVDGSFSADDLKLILRTSSSKSCPLFFSQSFEAEEKICSSKGRLLPSDSMYIVEHLKGGSCFYLPVSKTDRKRIVFHWMIYRENFGGGTNYVVELGNRFWWTYSRKFDGKVGFVNLTLLGFSSASQAMNVVLIPEQCKTGYNQKQPMSVVEFNSVAVRSQNLFQTFRYPFNESDSFIVRYQFLSDPKDESPNLYLFLDPHCEYELQLSLAPLVSLSQIIRFNYDYIPSIGVLLLMNLIALYNWLDEKSTSRICAFCFTFFVPLVYICLFVKSDDLIISKFIIVSICVGIVSFVQLIWAALFYIVHITLAKIFYSTKKHLNDKSVSTFRAIKFGVMSTFYIGICCLCCGSVAILIFGLHALIQKLRNPINRGRSFRSNLLSIDVTYMNLFSWLIALVSPSLIVWGKHLTVHGDFHLFDTSMHSAAFLVCSTLVFSLLTSFEILRISVVPTISLLICCSRYTFSLTYFISVILGSLFTSQRDLKGVIKKAD